MAKVDRKALDKIFNDMNDEIKEDLSEFDHWDDNWSGYDVEPQDYSHHFDDGDDWRNDELYLSDYDVMFGYHDYDSGDL